MRWTPSKLSFVALLLMGAGSPVQAIINFNIPLGNTTAPTGIGSEPTDPGFAHVGQVNGSTGVYLGDSWVLTANHVGAGNFTLGGQTYNYNGVDSHQIGGVDLRLFKLTTAPALPALSIATTSPTAGQGVVMIGAGRSPVSNDPTIWYVDTDPASWVWSTTDFPEADALAGGYLTNSTRVVRWGTNLVEEIAEDVAYGSYAPTDMIVTDFDSTNATAFEAQAVTNDSGSGVFVDFGSGWELAGTIVTVDIFNNQPGGAGTAVFGSLTLAIDLSQHAEEINSYLLTPVPELAHFGLLMSLALAAGLCPRRGGVRSKTPGCRRSL